MLCLAAGYSFINLRGPRPFNCTNQLSVSEYKILRLIHNHGAPAANYRKPIQIQHHHGDNFSHVFRLKAVSLCNRSLRPAMERKTVKGTPSSMDTPAESGVSVLMRSLQ
jgi:hypothetical protein